MDFWYFRIGDPPPGPPGHWTWTMLVIVITVLVLGGCADALGLIP